MALDLSGTPQIVEEVPFSGRNLWQITAMDAAVTTADALVAAPGAGKSLYITSVIASCIGTAATVGFCWLQDEDDNILLALTPTGDTDIGAAGTSFSIHLDKPIKLTANKALEVKSSQLATLAITVQGATAED